LQRQNRSGTKTLIACSWLVIATLILSSVALAEMDDPAMFDQMMAFMGAGLEDPIDAAVAAGTPSLDDPPIDFPNANATRAMSINANGDIVGSYTIGSATHGYLLRDGNFTSIDYPGSVFTEIWGINPQGDMIGRYRIAGDGMSRTRGFLLSRDGTFTDISVGNHMHTLPTGISPAGDVVGCFHDTNFLKDMRGYLQHGQSINTFEAFPSSMHNGVTRGGEMVVGISFDSPTTVHSYVVTKKGTTTFDFPAPGVTFTEAWDVNPSGTIVGYYNPVTSHGFVLDANGFRTVDVENALWTRIFGINPQGDIVGNYADSNNRIHGFLIRGRNQR
jgi:uncharacterized membrane protein